MPTLRDIKTRISAVQGTAKITQAMKMISAAKLRRAQDSILSARPYFRKIESITGNLIEAVGEDFSHPLIEKHNEVKNIVVIAVGSDRGFCGSFNNNLFKYIVKYLREDLAKEFPGAKTKVIPVGKRAVTFFRKEKIEIAAEFPGVFVDLDFSSVKSIIQVVYDKFTNFEIDRVIVFFNEFKNLLTQVPSLHTLLPIEPAKEVNPKLSNIDYIFEPNQKDILNDLIPTNLDIQLWKSLLESNAAEQAARMMAMDNATNNAKDLIRSLELVYNKARQSAITTEMLEIVSGAETLHKQ